MHTCMHGNGRKENVNSESSRKTQTQPFKTSKGWTTCRGRGHLFQGNGLFLLTASQLQFPKGLCSLDEGASSSKELALKFSSSLNKAIPLTIQSKQSICILLSLLTAKQMKTLRLNNYKG